MREALTVFFFSTFVLLAFFIFMFTGFLHGAPDVCLLTTPNGCYCEYFDPAKIGTFGVRQPWNTWSNLMGIVFGSFVAWGAWGVRTRDTDQGRLKNRMRNNYKPWYPTVYICVVVFLGLGSMWFHGSIVQWAGFLDLLSMFLFVMFIVYYSLLRCRPGADDSSFWEAIYLMAYLLLTLILTTVVYAANVDSASAILPLIIFAFGLEVANFFLNPDGRADWQGYLTIGLGALSFVIAMILRAKSETGGSLCFPHGFQFHAAWHWLAGVTSVSFYFYWIRCDLKRP